MAFTATVIGRVRVAGVDTNGAFFDPALVTLTDLAATSATGTAPVVTSASYNFVAGDVGAYVFVKSGTNWVPGWYQIASVAANAATLTATIGSVRLYSGDFSTFNTSAGCATTGSPTAGTWGVDYSQQDAAAASASLGTSNASTTFTDAGALFTVAHVANALRLTSGTNGTVGYYFITAVASTTSLTLDRNCSTGAMTNGVWKIGGAALTIPRLLNSANATGDKVVPGNTVFIRGSGGNNPTSADYTYTTQLNPVSGNATSGRVMIVGENGRPGVYGSAYDRWLTTATFVHVANIYVKATQVAQGYILGLGNQCCMKNCVFHANDLNIHHLAVSYSTVQDCEFIGHETAPTLRTAKYAIVLGLYGNLVHGNTFYRLGGSAISDTAGTMSQISNNLILKCKENGIVIAAGVTFANYITGNTIDGNAGNGIQIGNSASLGLTWILNNLITNHTTAAKAGILVSAGTTTVNDNLAVMGYNAFYNNTLNHSGVTIAATDRALSVNPYTQSDPPTTDWSVGEGVKGLAFPGAFQGGVSGVATTGYLDIGAVQRVEPSGGGGLLVHPGMTGGMRG